MTKSLALSGRLVSRPDCFAETNCFRCGRCRGWGPHSLRIWGNVSGRPEVLNTGTKSVMLTGEEEQPRATIQATAELLQYNVNANVFLGIVRWQWHVISYALPAWLEFCFHPAVRITASIQTPALLISIYGWRYHRRS